MAVSELPGMEEVELSSDEELALLASLLVREQRRKRRKPRKYWVHPLNAVRMNVGQYHTIMYDLRADDNKFFDYFRMSQNSFDDLLGMLEPHIKKRDTHMRTSISAEQRLTITLR